MLISLYLYCLETLNNTELFSSELNSEDLISDLKEKERELYGRLDPSIRHHIVKRGLSIKENIYVGFDTEFTNIGVETNSLLSSQLAVTTKTYVQIPRIEKYTTSNMDAKTNRLIPQQTNSSNFNYSKIEMSIQICIAKIRKIKYCENDLGMLILSECFKLIKGLSYVEKEDYTIFTLPRSVIQP